jgi:hypothetical protein
MLKRLGCGLSVSSDRIKTAVYPQGRTLPPHRRRILPGLQYFLYPLRPDERSEKAKEVIHRLTSGSLCPRRFQRFFEKFVVLSTEGGFAPLMVSHDLDAMAWL